MKDDESSNASEASFVEPLQPLFNWVGSKRRYCSKLLNLFPPDYDIDAHTYYEPFLGSGALLLYLQPVKAVVGDVDPNVVNAFKNVKDNPKKVISSIVSMYKGDVRGNYVNLCKTFSSLDRFKSTAAFIFISKHSFGSNLIYNKDKTGFTLCFRNQKIKTDYENISKVSEYLRDNKVTVKNDDFRKITVNAKKGDFVFMDPPYINTRITRKNYYNEQTNLSFDELVKELLRLHKVGCYIMLVNSNCKSLRDALKPHFKTKTFNADETILGAHKKEYANKRKECIYTNY